MRFLVPCLMTEDVELFAWGWEILHVDKLVIVGLPAFACLYLLRTIFCEQARIANSDQPAGHCEKILSIHCL